MRCKRETLLDWIEKIQNTGRNLTKWEEDFIEDLSEQMKGRGTLSERQEEILERIYSDRTS